MQSHRKTLSTVLAVAALISGERLSAAEPLTLDEAMATARAGAHEVRAAAARVSADEFRLRQARAHRLPQIRLQEIWTRTDSPAEAFGLMLNQERFSLAEFSAGDPNDPDRIENGLTRVELELPLYTGGEIRGRVRQAELAASAARRTALWIEDQAAWKAAEAYIRLIQIGERVALLEGTLATVEAHVALAAAYVEQGLVVRSELLRAEVERANIRELLTEARGQARTAAENLAFWMGIDGSRDWTLQALAAPVALEQQVEHWLASAGSRSDLEAARRLSEAARLEERVARSALKPKLGLLARHDLYDEGLFGSSGDSTALVAVASIDLFAGGRHRAAADAARSAADAAALDVDRFLEGVRLEVRVAYERAVSSRERQATAVSALVAAREAERITRERFAKGVAKTLDVLDALTARRESETRELIARTEAHLASLQLALSAGLRPETALSSAFAGEASVPPRDERKAPDPGNPTNEDGENDVQDESVRANG